MAEHVEPRKQRRRPGKSARTAEVQELLDTFARGLTEGDGPAIAALWETPALIVCNEFVRAVTSPDEVEEVFGNAKQLYAEHGIADTRAEILSLEWVGDGVAVVDVRWPYLDASGNENGEEGSTYTLRRDDSGELKVRVVLMRGAKDVGAKRTSRASKEDASDID